MQRELVQYVKLITNRLQILIFSGVNVLNGKKRQREHASLHEFQGCGQPDLHRESVDESAGQVFRESGGEASREGWDTDADRRASDGRERGEEKHEEEAVSRVGL